MKNIDDLRSHLFATLEALRDQNQPLDIERARAVADVAKTIIDTAKVEVDFMKVAGGGTGTGFIPDTRPSLPSGVNGRALPHSDQPGRTRGW